MQRNLSALLLASLCISSTLATKGVDLATAVSQSTFECFKSNGMSFAIPRAYKSYGTFDSNAINNIKNARAAGIQYVDVYMFPCRGKSASDQVSDLINNLGSSNYGMIWLDIETNPSSGCSWSSYSAASNCQFAT